MNKFLLATVLLSAMPVCFTRADDTPIDQVRQQLQEYAALSFEEKKARTNEIGDFISNLYDKINFQRRGESNAVSGPGVWRADALQVIELINEYRPQISN